MNRVATLIRKLKAIRWLKWLRLVHAWIGLWSAALGLLFGLSGILLNHRAVMKIPAASMEQSQFELTLPAEGPKDARAFAMWLQAELNIGREADKIVVEDAKEVHWAGQTLRQPSQWRVDFHNPQSSLSAEYWVGNVFVSVKRQDANFFAIITRLHKGVGMGAGWVLLTDTLAAGLVILSLSGLSMWTRTHGSRMNPVGLGFTSLGLALVIILSSL
ncbi:MAG: PepSY-associated TM helix domain-containing protein [Methylococcales bacterium]